MFMVFIGYPGEENTSLPESRLNDKQSRIQWAACSPRSRPQDASWRLGDAKHFPDRLSLFGVGLYR